jgi:hypothetical protein
MGYGITAYTLKIKTLEGFCGFKNSKDPDYLRNHYYDYFASSCMELTRDLRLKKYKAEQLWMDYLHGTIHKEASGLTYWRIVELFCTSFFGTRLQNDHWYPTSIDPLYKFSEFRMFYLNSVELPSPDDFPAVFTIKQEDFNQAKASILKAHQEDWYDINAVNQFNSWTDTAIDKEGDLILFYY